MRTLLQQLTNYANYHRDRRNIATHFVGIPMIVLGVATLLARPSFAVAGLPVALSPALALLLGSLVFYFRLDLRFGLVMALEWAGAFAFGTWIAAMSTGVWLGAGLSLFVVGWVIQFVGHYFEGKKPAFVDDLVGFLVGPLFVTAELGFMLGMRRDLLAQIEEQAGPTLIREKAPAANAA